MPDLSAVNAYIARHEARFIEELFELLRVPSVTGEPEPCAAMATLLAGQLGRLGFSAEVHPSDGNPVVVADNGMASGGPTVLIYGHYDVMPAGNGAEWTSPAFAPVVRDGRIFSRGAGDNKGQHFAHIKAIEALQACSIPTPPVRFFIEGNEETGSTHIAACLRAHRHRLAANLCFAADGPRHDSNRPTIYLGCRGLLGIELRVRGAKADLHSGNRGNVAPNAAWRLVQCLACLRDNEGRILIDNFSDDALPITEKDRALIRALPFHGQSLAAELGIAQLASWSGDEYFEALMFRPTLNINGLSSGYVGAEIKTIIPSHAQAKLDIRMVAGQTAEGVVRNLRDHLARHGFQDVELTVRTMMAPSRTPPDQPFVAEVVAAAREATGVEPLVYPVLGASIPQYAFVDVLGTPCVWCAYANSDEQNHAPNENIRIDCFLDGIRTTTALLARLATRQ